jgi:Na+-translocating ferredoxin:NAD+ oxidoreductase subunit B
MVSAVLSLGGIGLVAAVALGVAAKRFAVEVDPRELALLELLPGVNCGACGYPGCAGYAKALAKGETTPELCPPGGAEVTAKLAAVLGVAVTAAAPQVAVVLCQGDNRKAVNKYRYLGLADCSAAQRLADGPKACPGGCLGLGSCARACPFGAIEMTAEGLAVISRERCTGCRKCLAACPRQVIRMTPRAVTVHVLCNSHDPGAQVRKVCTVGCIACQLCVKAAPAAYRVEERLATVVYEQAEGADAAIARCPTHCIRDFAAGYPEGSTWR